MRLRFLISPQTGPSDTEVSFLHADPPPTGPADIELLAAELDDHVRLTGWRLIR